MSGDQRRVRAHTRLETTHLSLRDCAAATLGHAFASVPVGLDGRRRHLGAVRFVVRRDSHGTFRRCARDGGRTTVVA